jgi:asparagine synthase (glutamine-hydrolysing)
MPGIVGLITQKPEEQALRELEAMLGVLQHERFYRPGFWCDPASGVYVGWVERDGAFCQGMPLRNETGDVVLAFSGEEYPEPGIAQRLRARGHRLEPEGPEYLVHLSEEDASFPAGLNGRFHGLLTDRARNVSVLFNDRFGMHRLYYHEAKDGFYFAAEAKAILAVRPELRRADYQGLGEFVACGAVLENRTLFEGIGILPGGSAWKFRGGSLDKKSRYFDRSEWESQELLDSESYYRELREVFCGNLPRYFGGSAKIAMSLTGGLDTRMILACRKPDPGTLPCYTFGSMFRDNQDVKIARRVAAHCKQSHATVTAGREFLARFAEFARRAVYLTDGCVDVSRAPDLYLNEKARLVAPVRMTGNYGGEILRSVLAFKPVRPTGDGFCADFLAYVDQATATFAQAVKGHPVSVAVFQQAPWYLYGILALEQTQLSMRSPYLDNDFVRTVYRSPAEALARNEISLRLVADGDPGLLGIRTDRGLTGKRSGAGQTISRAALEFLFKAEYAYDMGMPQWLARTDHAFSALHLERLFLGRHKPFHFRVWYRDFLADYLREMLLDASSLSRPWVERKGLEAMVEGHLRGTRNYTNEIHKLLTLELLHRTFFEAGGMPVSDPAPRMAVTCSA